MNENGRKVKLPDSTVLLCQPVYTKVLVMNTKVQHFKTQLKANSFLTSNFIPSPSFHVAIVSETSPRTDCPLTSLKADSWARRRWGKNFFQTPILSRKFFGGKLEEPASYVFPICRLDFRDIHLKTDFSYVSCSLPPRLSQVNLRETFQTISSWWDLKINKPQNFLLHLNTWVNHCLIIAMHVPLKCRKTRKLCSGGGEAGQRVKWRTWKTWKTWKTWWQLLNKVILEEEKKEDILKREKYYSIIL